MYCWQKGSSVCISVVTRRLTCIPTPFQEGISCTLYKGTRSHANLSLWLCLCSKLRAKFLPLFSPCVCVSSLLLQCAQLLSLDGVLLSGGMWPLLPTTAAIPGWSRSLWGYVAPSPNHTTGDYCTTVCLVCSSAFSVFSDHIGMSECAGVACLSQNSISFFHLLSRASFTFLALFSSSAVCFQFSCPFATSSDVLFHFSCLLTYHLTHQPGYVIAYVSFGYSDTYVCKEARETAY